MTKAEYTHIKRQLDFRPSHAWAFATLVMHGATLALAIRLLFGGSAARAAGTVLLAVAAFQAFAIVHECGHGAFSRSRLLNVFVGHLASVIALTPFYPWQYIHTQHHVWAGHLHNDPAVATLARWRLRGSVPWIARVAWLLWVPAIAASQLVIFATYPLRMLREGKLSRSRAIRSAISVLVCFGPHIAVVAFWGFRVEWIAALLGYLVWTEIVNVPHHVDRPMFDHKLPVWEQAIIARSCVYPRVLSDVLVLNFNLHSEHHVFPTLPWYRLPQARSSVKSAAGADYEESRGLRWVALNRFRSLRDVALPEVLEGDVIISDDAA